MAVASVNAVRYETQGADVIGQIDTPAPGALSDVHALEIGGWAVGKSASVVSVELVYDGEVRRRVEASSPADAGAISALPRGAARFWTWVGLLGLPPKFELSVNVVLDGDTREQLGVIHGTRQFVGVQPQPTLRPILLTSLGRTGTTFVMHVLSQLDQVVVYPLYPYEIRPGRYWLHLLGVLSEPANHLQSAHWANFAGTLSWAGHNPYFTDPVTSSTELRHWLGRRYTTRLAQLFTECIDDFYRIVASTQGKVSPRYFAEKHYPDHVPSLAYEVYDEPREIILVRDPRDMLCSILAFNRKRGYDGFGAPGSAIEDYVDILARDAMHLVRAWRARGGTALLLRYEDLVQNPTDVLRRLLEYLELQGQDPLQVSEAAFASAGAAEAFFDEHRTSPSPESSIGRWRRELDPSTASYCEGAFAAVMEAFGYPPAHLESA